MAFFGGMRPVARAPLGEVRSPAVSPRYAALATETVQNFTTGNWLDVRLANGNLTALLRVGDKSGRAELGALNDALGAHKLEAARNPEDPSTFFVTGSTESPVGNRAFRVTVERGDALATKVADLVKANQFSKPGLNEKGRATVDVDLGGTAFRGHEEIVALHVALQKLGFGIVHTPATENTPSAWSVSRGGVVKIEARPGGGPLVDHLNASVRSSGIRPRVASWRDMFG